MRSSPELQGLIPLLDWPHDIVGPYLCPSATPQGSQGLTLVSQDKVRGIWEWGCVRTHPNAVVCSERLHLACLPTKRPRASQKAMPPARRSKAACAPRASQAPLAPAGNVGQRQSVDLNLELNISRGEWSCSPNPLAIAGPCPNFQWPFGIQKCPLSPDKCSRDSLRPGMEGREGGREK